MGTNPIGKHTKNLAVNVPDNLYLALKQLADRNNMKLGAYIRLILHEAQEKGVQFEIKVTSKSSPPDGPSGRAVFPPHRSAQAKLNE